MPKKTTQDKQPLPASKRAERPPLAAVVRATEESRAARTERQPGSVVNKQLDHDSAPNPDGSVSHFAYYSMDPVQMKAGRIQKERDRLLEAGYWLADGEEYIPEVTTAEIWMTYADIARASHERRRQRMTDNENLARRRLVH